MVLAAHVLALAQTAPWLSRYPDRRSRSQSARSPRETARGQPALPGRREQPRPDLLRARRR